MHGMGGEGIIAVAELSRNAEADAGAAAARPEA